MVMTVWVLFGSLLFLPILVHSQCTLSPGTLVLAQPCWQKRGDTNSRLFTAMNFKLRIRKASSMIVSTWQYKLTWYPALQLLQLYPA